MTNPDYQRGYNKGRASVDTKHLRKALEEANERAIKAEAGMFGPCQKCVRWTRNQECHWGYCEFPKVVDAANTTWWGEPDHKVCTQENFGCVRFTPKDGQERTLPSVAENTPASKPYDPSIESAADGSNACGETIALAPAGARVDD